jgi:UPF0755 protein
MGIWIGVRETTPPSGAQSVRVHIAKGTNVGDIAALLEQYGVVRRAVVFSLYVRYTGQAPLLQAGTYVLRQGMTIAEVADVLQTGKTIERSMVRITIPEGYTVMQTIDVLASKGFDKHALMREAYDAHYWRAQSQLMTRFIPEHAPLRVPLEGYIVPQTYDVPRDASARAVWTRLIAQWDDVFAQLPDDWNVTLAKQQMSVHEWVTLASLVEREVVVDEERALVAGVIVHRLKRRMPLQIDATVQYALPVPKQRLLHADLRIDSPYNTYRNPSLPPGPIASPGVAALRAALNPTPTDYLYYVTKKDGSGAHHFSKTYNEHRKYIAMSKKK